MIPDYSESLLTIQAMRKQAHEALLRHDWKTACDCADAIVYAAGGMRIYAIDQLARK